MDGWPSSPSPSLSSTLWRAPRGVQPGLPTCRPCPPAVTTSLGLPPSCPRALDLEGVVTHGQATRRPG
eukprot:scaffold600_cov385-Prasinococcus_capsulatus_cf.AAC.3